jgi:hypothetical protein
LTDDLAAGTDGAGSPRGGGRSNENTRTIWKSTVSCGSCDSRLIVTNAKNRYGTIYPYFACLGRHQKLTSCTRKAMLISIVEELVEDYYEQVQLAPEFQDKIREPLTEDLRTGRDHAAAEERELTIRRQRLINERAKLLQAH